MVLALIIPVKEDLTELRKLLKNASPMMILEMKKEGEKGISKQELMDRIGVCSQSIQNWRTIYKNEGLEKKYSFNIFTALQSRNKSSRKNVAKV